MTMTTEELRCTGTFRALECEMRVRVEDGPRAGTYYVHDMYSTREHLMSVARQSIMEMDAGGVEILEQYDSESAAKESDFFQCFVFLNQLARSAWEQLEQ